MLDERIAELEDGWRDLLSGLRAIIKVLRDENEVLRARLDERRMMGVAAPESKPEALPTSVAPQLVAVSAPVAPLRKKQTPKLVQKLCERCGCEITVRAKTKFCDVCFRAQAGERMALARAARRINGESTSADRRLAGEVDMRIATSRTA